MLAANVNIAAAAKSARASTQVAQNGLMKECTVKYVGILNMI